MASPRKTGKKAAKKGGGAARGKAKNAGKKAAHAALKANREKMEESMTGQGPGSVGHAAAVDLAADPTVLARPETGEDHPTGESRYEPEVMNQVVTENLEDDDDVEVEG